MTLGKRSVLKQRCSRNGQEACLMWDEGLVKTLRIMTEDDFLKSVCVVKQLCHYVASRSPNMLR